MSTLVHLSWHFSVERAPVSSENQWLAANRTSLPPSRVTALPGVESLPCGTPLKVTRNYLCYRSSRSESKIRSVSTANGAPAGAYDCRARNWPFTIYQRDRE